MPAARAKRKGKASKAGKKQQRSSSAAAPGSKRSGQVDTAKQPSRATKRQRTAHAELLDFEEDAEYDAPNLTSQQLQGIALQSQQSKRQNTQKSYGVQDRKFKWFLEHDSSGSERQKAFSPNLLAATAPDVLVAYLQWLDSGMPGYVGRSSTDKLRESTLKQVHASLQALFEQQATAQHNRAEAPVSKLFDIKPYRLQYQNMMAGIKGKGERLEGVDPQANTAEDTFSREDLSRLSLHLLQQETAQAARNLSIFMYMAGTISRHDDANLLNLADLGAPMEMKCIGPAVCFLVSAVLCGGKRMADAKRKAFVGGIRHCDPALCWQGALFRHLIITYTLCKVPFPTITDDKTWYNAAIWPVSDPTKNVDYDTLARQLSSLLVELGIVIGKVLHSFRVYAAQFLDEQGVADEVIMRMGRWLYQSLYNSYLRYFKPEGLLGLAGWPRAAHKDYNTFFAPRFCVPVPVELQQLLMPLLSTLEKQVHDMGQAATPSRRAFLKLLAYGTGVVVQDALELADLAPLNPVHSLLLRHPTFRAMHAEYQQLKAVGYFDAFNPPNTRELVQQILHKLACANSPQQALGYTCVPMRAQLTTAEELEAQQAANLELLVAAADQEAAADGGGDLLGEQVSGGDLIGLEGPPAPAGVLIEASKQPHQQEQQQQQQEQQQQQQQLRGRQAAERAAAEAVLPLQSVLPLQQQQRQAAGDVVQDGQAYHEEGGVASSSQQAGGSKSSAEDSGPAVSESLACRVCDMPDDEEHMLVCDTCLQGFHTSCLGMKRGVPEGDWECPGCTRRRRMCEQPTRRRSKAQQQTKHQQAAGAEDQATSSLLGGFPQRLHMQQPAMPAAGAVTSSEQQHLRDMRRQQAATQQVLQAPLQQRPVGGMADWRGVNLPHQQTGLAVTGAFHHLALQQGGGLPLAQQMGVMAQAAVHMQHLLPQQMLLPQLQEQQLQTQQQQQQLLLQQQVQQLQQQQQQQQLQLLQQQQQWHQVPGHQVQYMQSQVQLLGQAHLQPQLAPPVPGSYTAAAAVAASSVPLPGAPSGSGDCPYHVQLPRKLSGFQSLSHVWAWYTSPLAEAGGLSPKELEQRYGSYWRSGARNRQTWCRVMAVVRAVQQRVGTAVSGSHRGARLSEHQIVEQLDVERGSVQVATFIRNKCKFTPDSTSADEQLGAEDRSEPDQQQQQQQRRRQPAASGAAASPPTGGVAPLPPLPQPPGSSRSRQRLRPELQGGVERDAVLRFIPGGPNDLPPAPGEQHEAGVEAPLEELGNSSGRAVYRR